MQKYAILIVVTIIFEHAIKTYVCEEPQTIKLFATK